MNVLLPTFLPTYLPTYIPTLFSHFKNATDFHWGTYEPSSLLTNELHGLLYIL